VALKKAIKISDLKNLGPGAESICRDAGIGSAQKLVQIGWKKAMRRISNAHPKNRHAMFAYAVIGALTNRDLTAIPENERQEAKDFMKTLAPAKKPKPAKAEPRAKPVGKKKPRSKSKKVAVSRKKAL